MDPVTLEGRHSSNKAVLCLVGDYTVHECETDKKQNNSLPTETSTAAVLHSWFHSY